MGSEEKECRGLLERCREEFVRHEHELVGSLVRYEAPRADSTGSSMAFPTVGVVVKCYLERTVPSQKKINGYIMGDGHSIDEAYGTVSTRQIPLYALHDRLDLIMNRRSIHVDIRAVDWTTVSVYADEIRPVTPEEAQVLLLRALSGLTCGGHDE